MEMAQREHVARTDARGVQPTKLSIIVGENLRHLRRAQGFSLEQLSHISGVSRAMLGQIETGKSAPTINLLGRIADALKVSVPSLISAPGGAGTVIVPRDRSTVLSSTEGGFSSRALFPWGEAHAVELYEITISAGHTELVAAGLAGAKKTLVLISGDLEVVVGDDGPARLGEGDAILFNADTEHRFHNTGSREAKAFLVMSGNAGANAHPRPA